jgi:O-antigen ligase
VINFIEQLAIQFHPGSVSLRHEEHPAADAAAMAVYAIVLVAVFYVTMRRPALGTASLLVLAPFALARYVGPTSITLLKVGIVGLIVALAFRRIPWTALASPAARVQISVFLVALFAIALSAIRAEYIGPVVRETFKTLEYAACFGGALLSYVTDPDDRQIWRALKIVTVLVCGSALLDYLVGAHSGLVVHGEVVPRSAGVLEGPNQLAGWLEILTPILFARALLHRDKGLIAILSLACITQLLTLSRGGILGVIIGALVVLVIMRPSQVVAVRIVVGTAIATAFLFILGGSLGLTSRLFSTPEANEIDHLANRPLLWHAALTLWQSSPIVGVGAGNYEFELSRAGLPNVRTHANSIYLQSLAEGGIVMLASTLYSFGATILVLARSAVRRPLVVGALAATVALATHQVFDDLFFFTKVGTTYWLIIGIAVAEIVARQLFERHRSHVFEGFGR